ncbi:DUF3899 domain-containing protein [Halobacillus seohaensis]|uniref:DUF3899 domain-containing protein n=1 Tax=Halobacillus seohaensis TaxID=447421 RepID=A0ABW2EKG5_9BACI
MGFVRNKWGFVVLNLFFIVAFIILTASTFDLVTLIDFLFYFSFFYISIGLFLWIIKGGFFDAITYSFRKVTNRISNNGDYMDDFEEKPLPSQMFKKKFMHFFLFQGIVLLIGLLVLLTFYYN